MITIWKFPIDLVTPLGFLTDTPVIDMPEGAVILTMQLQDGIPTLWALVDPSKPPTPRVFHIVGTGHPVPTRDVEYINTWQRDGFVFHVFERKGA